MKNCALFFLMWMVITLSVAAQDTTRVSLLFAGDIMGHDSQIASAYDPVTRQHDYTSCFQFIKPYIQSVDVAIGNLEVTLAGPPFKGYPQFSSPDNLAQTLKDVGFDVLVTANNHSADRGKKGIERTITMLDSLSILHTGTFVDSTARGKDYPLMVYKNGFTLALLNYTYGTNGLPVHRPNIVNLLDTSQIRKDLLKAKAAKPDAIIVFTHWGAEYQSLPSRVQKDLGEFCFSNGADIVIGAHPHVIQPMEWRKDKDQFIAYSLGNFVSGQRKRYTDGGAMTYIELEKITFRPDSAITTIDSAGYMLEWVYRTADANKDYYILPVSGGEEVAKSFISDAASKEAFQLFANDSRTLFRQYNKHVSEVKEAPTVKPVAYKVLLLETGPGEDPWKILTSQKAYLWGVDREDKHDGRTFWLSGNFDSYQEAEQYRNRYIAQHREARVVRYENGVMVE